MSLANHQVNPLVEMICNHTDGVTGTFDVIMDYKAAHRPPVTPVAGAKSHWTHEALQVQLYAWLRAQQPMTAPVKAAILIYVNELSPSKSEFVDLQKEMVQGRTDVVPAAGSADYYALTSWYAGVPLPTFTDAFLLQRAVRIVPVDPSSVNNALQQIDSAVADIELCAMRENATGNILSNWLANGDDHDCNACDFRRFCPSPAWARTNPSAAPQPVVAPG